MISLYLNPYVCVWADRGRGAVCWLGKNKKGKKKKRNTGGEKGKDKYILYEERWIINFLLWGGGIRKIQDPSTYDRIHVQSDLENVFFFPSFFLLIGMYR